MVALRTKDGLGDRRRSRGIPRLGRRSIHHRTINTQYNSMNMHVTTYKIIQVPQVECQSVIHNVMYMKEWVGGKLNKRR